MKFRAVTFILILCMALSMCVPALADETADAAAPEDWREWSQSDERWGTMSISSLGYSHCNMAKEGCLVTAICKTFINAAQQLPENFTPADCLSMMHSYKMLNNTGSFYSGIRMNTNGLLATYAPELTYVADDTHGAWGRTTAVKNIGEMIENGSYVIVKVYNAVSGNSHFMAVDRVADDTVYVMDNREVIDLYADGCKYRGITQTLRFEYSGTLPYPAADSLAGDVQPEAPEVEDTDASLWIEEPQVPGASDVLQEEPGEAQEVPPESTLLKNFTLDREYGDIFPDVIAGEWYYDGVVTSFKSGLMNGVDGGLFAPDGELSVAQVITVAARINATYNYGPVEFSGEGAWYETYVNYAIVNGIIAPDQFDSYTRSATRYEVAQVLAAAIPQDAMADKNAVIDGFVPDVPADHPAYYDVYRLYRTGIVNGGDQFCYSGNKNITRKEAACIFARIVDSALRETITVQ